MFMLANSNRNCLNTCTVWTFTATSFLLHGTHLLSASATTTHILPQNLQNAIVHGSANVFRLSYRTCEAPNAVKTSTSIPQTRSAGHDQDNNTICNHVPYMYSNNTSLLITRAEKKNKLPHHTNKPPGGTSLATATSFEAQVQGSLGLRKIFSLKEVSKKKKKHQSQTVKTA